MHRHPIRHLRLTTYSSAIILQLGIKGSLMFLGQLECSFDKFVKQSHLPKVEPLALNACMVKYLYQEAVLARVGST